MLVALTASLAWALAPAEWSFVDDAGMKTSLLDYIHADGVVGGVAAQISHLFTVDRSWGLFRPFYWVYGGIFYLLNPSAAHALRMLMFAAAVIIPSGLVYRRARQRGGRAPVLAVWTLLVLLANPTLYEGLTLNSLQELSGLSLVALGILVERRSWPRSLIWLGAAWLKAPFAWLLLGWGVVLLVRHRERRLGAATVIAALATLGAATYFARTGTYTHALSFTVGTFRASMTDLASSAKVAVAVLVVGVIGLRVSPARLVPGDPTALAVGIGAVGYLVNMLPWGLGSYYASPVIWMASTACLLAVANAEPSRPWALARLATATTVATLVVAATLAGRTTVKTLSQEFDRSASLLGIAQWAQAHPTATIGVNAQEATVRLPEVVRTHDVAWRGDVVYVPPGHLVRDRLDYYIVLPDQGDGTNAYEGRILRQWRHAIVYAVNAGG